MKRRGEETKEEGGGREEEISHSRHLAAEFSLFNSSMALIEQLAVTRDGSLCVTLGTP